MSNGYQELLDATIRHLEALESRGVRHVAVSPETLNALGRAPARPAAAAPSRPEPMGMPAPRVEPVRNVIPPVVVKSPVAPRSVSPPGPALEAQAKAAAFADLSRRVAVCVKCPQLASSRKNTVFGVGSTEARMLFVGEAPGADEDAQGEPFVGKAGQLLTKIIETMGLRRGEVYIANILKCRPDTPGQSAGNRKPTPGEMQTCISYLHEQIDLIRPQVIVALGATAVEGLLGQTVGISKLRGNWQTYRGTPLMPTYHPAYLLRNQALSEKRKVWEDMLAVMARLGLPVSDKQRRYFLK